MFFLLIGVTNKQLTTENEFKAAFAEMGKAKGNSSLHTILGSKSNNDI
jgi:two-component SAPR family response regulator